uniref:ANK_REP_REGION domain-containing protein n=1 Tax=Macrostomum lignano TaxID=282301 RepID=A0A1I8FBV2_9PLAT
QGGSRNARQRRETRELANSTNHDSKSGKYFCESSVLETDNPQTMSHNSREARDTPRLSKGLDTKTESRLKSESLFKNVRTKSNSRLRLIRRRKRLNLEQRLTPRARKTPRVRRTLRASQRLSYPHYANQVEDEPTKKSDSKSKTKTESKTKSESANKEKPPLRHVDHPLKVGLWQQGGRRGTAKRPGNASELGNQADHTGTSAEEQQEQPKVQQPNEVPQSRTNKTETTSKSGIFLTMSRSPASVAEAAARAQTPVQVGTGLRRASASSSRRFGRSTRQCRKLAPKQRRAGGSENPESSHNQESPASAMEKANDQSAPEEAHPEQAGRTDGLARVCRSHFGNKIAYEEDQSVMIPDDVNPNILPNKNNPLYNTTAALDKLDKFPTLKMLATANIILKMKDIVIGTTSKSEAQQARRRHTTIRKEKMGAIERVVSRFARIGSAISRAQDEWRHVVWVGKKKANHIIRYLNRNVATLLIVSWRHIRQGQAGAKLLYVQCLQDFSNRPMMISKARHLSASAAYLYKGYGFRFFRTAAEFKSSNHMTEAKRRPGTTLWCNDLWINSFLFNERNWTFELFLLVVDMKMFVCTYRTAEKEKLNGPDALNTNVSMKKRTIAPKSCRPSSRKKKSFRESRSRSSTLDSELVKLSRTKSGTRSAASRSSRLDLCVDEDMKHSGQEAHGLRVAASRLRSLIRHSTKESALSTQQIKNVDRRKKACLAYEDCRSRGAAALKRKRNAKERGGVLMNFAFKTRVITLASFLTLYKDNCRVLIFLRFYSMLELTKAKSTPERCQVDTESLVFSTVALLVKDE